MRRYPRAASPRVIAVTMTGVFGLASFGLVTFARESDGTTAPATTVITHPSYPYDYSDERILVGAAEFVFLGEVIEQIGNKGVPTSAPDIEIPQTQFLVKVIEPIKGRLPTEIIVSQSSGVDKSSGDLVLIDGDPLLKPGETVLFTVNAEPDLDWYTIVAGPFGATRAEDANEAAALVAQFTDAERHQFIPVPDPDFVPPDVEKEQARRSE